jgi:uncharacterized membrane protein
MLGLKLNSELRAEARASLQGKWGISAVILLIYLVIVGIGELIPFVSFLFTFLIGVVLAYGLLVTFLKSFRGQDPEIGDMFLGFQNYGKVLGTMLLMYLYCFLWSLLLVIPGIIKGYSYAMTPYLLYDNPSLSAEELICTSMKMMKGHKMKLFLLDLSFIGWALLCILTLCIGFLWLVPYTYSARAAFYEDLRTAAEASGSLARR